MLHYTHIMDHEPTVTKVTCCGLIDHVTLLPMADMLMHASHCRGLQEWAELHSLPDEGFRSQLLH